MISEHIERLVQPVREGLARGLVAVGLRPNHITILGMLFTIGAGVAVAAGRAQWRPWAVSLIVAAGACDLLDGSMAQLGGLKTRFGALLDSTCDRVSDAALYFGAAFYYILAWPAEQGGGPPNATLGLLALVGLVWAYLVSYIRARAGHEGLRAGGGFWQRPERVVTILLGLAFHHLPTAVWILAILPATTVAHRLWRARRTAVVGGAADDDQPRGLLGVVLWRWGRGTLPFDIQAGATIVALMFLDVPPADLLRQVWAGLIGA